MGDKTKDTYVALCPINHDHDNYGIGQELALTQAQAEPLLAVGAVQPKPEAEPALAAKKK